MFVCPVYSFGQLGATWFTVFGRGTRNKILAGTNAAVSRNGSQLRVLLVPLSDCLRQRPAKRLSLSAQTASTPRRRRASVAVQATVDPCGAPCWSVRGERMTRSRCALCQNGIWCRHVVARQEPHQGPQHGGRRVSNVNALKGCGGNVQSVIF